MNHEQLADAILLAVTSEPRRRMRDELAQLDPLEALPLLGMLLTDTMQRFPHDQRADKLAMFLVSLLATMRVELPDA